ncbi:unnamed protein product [Cuscuta campestris]|uniref:Uncharacterized protein n=1 Tax=Cuscuta campestris TaxID=132261 RepID=A0A484LYN4_9ASTE|nr:unnamed protein product [Cuscuta campestris]
MQDPNPLGLLPFGVSSDFLLDWWWFSAAPPSIYRCENRFFRLGLGLPCALQFLLRFLRLQLCLKKPSQRRRESLRLFYLTRLSLFFLLFLRSFSQLMRWTFGLCHLGPGFPLRP